MCSVESQWSGSKLGDPPRFLSPLAGHGRACGSGWRWEERWGSTCGAHSLVWGMEELGPVWRVEAHSLSTSIFPPPAGQFQSSLLPILLLFLTTFMVFSSLLIKVHGAFFYFKILINTINGTFKKEEKIMSVFYW